MEEIAVWDHSADADPRDVLFVVGPASDPERHGVREWVDRGSSVLVLDKSMIDTWASVYSKPIVVVDATLMETLVGLVERDRLRFLAPEAEV